MKRAALLRDLTDVATQLGHDELRVFLLLATRIRDGQARYGHLNLSRDRRNFKREILEEMVDGLFYIGAALLPRARRRRGGAACLTGHLTSKPSLTARCLLPRCPPRCST